MTTKKPANVADEIASLEILADLAEDMDQAAKAKRLRARARKLKASLDKERP